MVVEDGIPLRKCVAKDEGLKWKFLEHTMKHDLHQSCKICDLPSLPTMYGGAPLEVQYTSCFSVC